MRAALRNLFALYDTYGKVVLALALVGLVSSAAMAFFFGIAVSLMHGIFLVVVSIGFALGPHLAHKVWLKGARTSAVIIGVLCIPLGIIEFYSHNGYTAGLRGVNIGDAKLTQVTYGDSRSSVATLKARVEDFAAKAKDLDADLVAKTQTNVGGWTVKTKPASSAELDGSIEAKALEVANESKRGGCKAKCEARTNELAHLKVLRAAAKAIEDNHEQYTAALGALQQAQKDADHKAAGFKHSAAEQQATSIAKLVSMISAGSLKPTDLQAEAVEQSANLGMAVAAMLQPALFFFIAGFFMVGIRETKWAASGPEPAPTQMTEDHITPPMPMPAAYAAQASPRNMVVRAKTNTIADLRASIRNLAAPKQAFGTT